MSDASVPAPLIVTLAFDPDTAAWLHALRQAHFPPARNVVPAHVTLFHALPGAHEAEVAAHLGAVAAAQAPFDVSFPDLRFLGRGVALRVESAPLAALRSVLARPFADVLTPQDAQGFRPHATIQNKVAPEAARATLAHLHATFTPRTGAARGLDLWRYRGGPWEPVDTYAFGGQA